jgi:hypothetical protein
VDPTNIDVRKKIAFVAQDDSLQVTATPREAIRFSAKLRLPRTITEEELDTLTNRMIEELGLNDCADTIVGGAFIKGISGGERKRASVGVGESWYSFPCLFCNASYSHLRCYFTIFKNSLHAPPWSFLMSQPPDWTASMLLSFVKCSRRWPMLDLVSSLQYISRRPIFFHPLIASFY